MQWRQIFARRPKWWVTLVNRVRTTLDVDPESGSSDQPHRRSSAERARFWEEFRDGQREADRRALEAPKVLVPCNENGDGK